MGNDNARRQSMVVMIHTDSIDQPERVPTGVFSKPKYRLSMQN